MRLIDILELCDIDFTILIYDEDGDLVDKYDGKDSIDTIYNNWKVISIAPSNNPRELEIYIEEE